MTHVRILRKNDLKKMYRLASDIIKGCKNDDYKYLFIDSEGMRGTDSYRNGKYSGITFDEPIAIPIPVVDAIKGAKAETVELALIKEAGREYIQFNLKGKELESLFTIKLNKPLVQYPAFDSVEKLKCIIVDSFTCGTKDLKDALVEMNKISKYVIFEVWLKGIKLKAVDDIGNEKKTIDILTTKSTRPFKIALNPKYVLDYLEKHDSLSVKIHFTHSSSYVWMEEYGESYDYILMPLALID